MLGVLLGVVGVVPWKTRSHDARADVDVRGHGKNRRVGRSRLRGKRAHVMSRLKGKRAQVRREYLKDGGTHGTYPACRHVALHALVRRRR